MNSFIVGACYNNSKLKSEDANEKNFTARCNFCPNKRISGNVTSSSNFLFHIKVCRMKYGNFPNRGFYEMMKTMFNIGLA